MQTKQNRPLSKFDSGPAMLKRLNLIVAALIRAKKRGVVAEIAALRELLRKK